MYFSSFCEMICPIYIITSNKLYHKNNINSIYPHKVAGSSPKGREKDAKVKKDIPPSGVARVAKRRERNECHHSVVAERERDRAAARKSRSDRGSGRFGDGSPVTPCINKFARWANWHVGLQT